MFVPSAPAALNSEILISGHNETAVKIEVKLPGTSLQTLLDCALTVRFK